MASAAAKTNTVVAAPAATTGQTVAKANALTLKMTPKIVATAAMFVQPAKLAKTGRVPASYFRRKPGLS
jgi:hypothetical protein